MSSLPPMTRQDALTIMATEHFTLQGARAATISDANGRTGFFLSTVSAIVVALALVAQLSEVGRAFTVFALILFPTLLVVGLATFERLLQLGVENVRTVAAMNRIRHYYLEVAPELEPHMTLSPHDDTKGVLWSLGAVGGKVRPWDALVSNAGVIAIVDAVLLGVLVAFVAGQLGAAMEVSAAVGVVGGVLLLAALLRYLARTWRTASRSVGVRFPSDRDIDLSHITSAGAETSLPPV